MFAVYALLFSSAYPMAFVNDKDDPFVPKILVRAQAIHIVYSEQSGEKDGLQKVTFQIEHVYCGDAKIEGETFQSEFSIATVNRQGPTFRPRIKKGEVGIWRLEPDPDDQGKLKAAASLWGLGNRYSGEGLAIPTPSRNIVGWYSDCSYANALKWADVVEKVYKAKRTDRPDLLKRYILNDNPHIAAWAIWILAEYRIPNLIPSLDKALQEPAISIAAQVTIDTILSKINRKKWLRSKNRVKLLEHWIGCETSKPHDVMMIALRFKDALEYGDLDWDLWLPLMQKWVVQHYLDDVLEYQLYSTYRSNGPRTVPARDLIIRHAFHLLKTSDDENTQAYAAKWLDQIDDLNDDEKRTIKDLRKNTKNPWIRDLLDNAIGNSPLRKIRKNTGNR